MKNVLIVDDSLSMRTTVKMVLQVAGYNVNDAEDGLEALNLLKNYCPDLILLDVNMPKMNGLDLLRELRKIPSCRLIPVIMLTTRTDEESIQRAEKEGVKGWITKPFNTDDLVNMVNNLLIC